MADERRSGSRAGRRENAAQSAPPDDKGMRLQKYLAHAGVASRRHAEELIVAGNVVVNGAVVRELGTRVDPDRDEVRVHGRLVHQQTDWLYVLLHKPVDTVTTAYDPEGRRTVLDLLPATWYAARVYPVGRLDWDTEGLLLLTNDGDLALRMTHPRYALTKEYAAQVEGIPSRDALAAMRNGLLLPGEERPTAPARVWVRPSAPAPEAPYAETTWLGIELHEGRNRQVRRMLDAIGHPALRLRRVRVGPLTLGTLEPGAARLLTSAELVALRHAVGLESPVQPA